MALQKRIEQLEESEVFGPSGQRIRDMSPEDVEAVILYLWGSNPTYSDAAGRDAVEALPAYARGKELIESRRKPIIPYHLDPHAKRSTCASLQFELVNHREPEPGDVLRPADLERHADSECHLDEWFAKVWPRHAPVRPCPLRADYKELHHREANRQWRRVEEEAFGCRYTCAQDWEKNRALLAELEKVRPLVGVVFLGVIDGQHRVDPLVRRRCSEETLFVQERAIHASEEDSRNCAVIGAGSSGGNGKKEEWQT